MVCRDGLERSLFQQLIENTLRVALGNSNPISQSFKHALRLGIMRLVVTGNVVRTESFNPGDADWFSRAIRVFCTMVGMQTMWLGDCKLAVRIMAFAVARGRDEYAHHLINVVVIEAHVMRHRVGRSVG